MGAILRMATDRNLSQWARGATGAAPAAPSDAAAAAPPGAARAHRLRFRSVAIRKIAPIGHPVLRQRAREVSVEELRDPATQRLIDDLIDTMRRSEEHTSELQSRRD